MLGLIFIYWIWKAFSNLAIEYGKNKWTYFFIGIGSYYGTSFLAGIIYGIIVILINGVDAVNGEDYNSTEWNLLFLVLGGLGCYGVYKFLEQKAEKERELIKKEGIESIGAVGEN